MRRVLLLVLAVMFLSVPALRAAFVDEMQDKEIEKAKQAAAASEKKVDELSKTVEDLKAKLAAAPAAAVATEAATPAPTAAATAAPAKQTFTTSGTLWTRYTYSGMSASASTNGFTVDRAYFDVKGKNEELGLETRVTIDLPNSSGAQKNIDWGAWIKSAYIDMNKLVPFVKVRMGVQPVYFGTGDYWTYPIAALPVESRIKNFFSSADAGIAVLGKLPEGMGEFEVSAANGNGYKLLETNKEKTYMANLKFIPGSLFGYKDAYIRGSYATAVTQPASGSDLERMNASAVAIGLKSDAVWGYVEYLVKSDPFAASTKSGVSVTYSAYIGAKVMGPLSAHLRFDEINQDTKAKLDETQLYVAGLSWDFSKELVFQLNYELENSKYGQAENKNNFIAQTKWAW